MFVYLASPAPPPVPPKPHVEANEGEEEQYAELDSLTEGYNPCRPTGVLKGLLKYPRFI